MGLDSCMKCIKYTLFIFNFFFWLVGVGILALGLYLLIDPIAAGGKLLGSDEDPFHAFRLTFIVVGAVIMLLGFLGCCGSILENKCMLLTFFILMTLVFITLVVAGLLIVFMRDNGKKYLLDTFGDNYGKLLKEYKSSQNAANTTDAIHHIFSCCGRNGTRDFAAEGLEEPKSCANHSNEGCVEKIGQSLDKHWLTAVIVVFSVAAVTLIGMILSILLCCALRIDYDY